MELESTGILNTFYRLVGSDPDDPALTDLGEAENDVAFTYLTRGVRNAQLWLIDQGYDGWKRRTTSALSWTGTDAADGGRYSAVPSDFLRAYGDRRKSALVEANGDRWGRQIDPEENHLKGNLYYIEGEKLWLARNASPPTTVYLDYHYTHPLWSADVTIDFPNRMRQLIAPEAASVAAMENWLPGGPEMIQKIDRAVARAREECRKLARETKSPRQFRKPFRMGNRY